MITLVESLVERINQLELRVEALENQINKNSHNSSKPPSSDGFGKRTNSLRQKSDRSNGGQLGHPGSTLDWCEDPNSVLVYPVKSCSGCGISLKDIPVNDLDLRQVHDLPMIQIAVT